MMRLLRLPETGDRGGPDSGVSIAAQARSTEFSQKCFTGPLFIHDRFLHVHILLIPEMSNLRTGAELGVYHAAPWR